MLLMGGNSGVGLEAARRLARERTPLILASRNRAASDEAALRIRAESGNAGVEAMTPDLGSLDGVRAFAKEIDARGRAVAHAGVQRACRRRA